VAAWIVLAMLHLPCARATEGPAVSGTVVVAEQSLTFGMLEARVDVTDEWLVSAAAAYLDPGPARAEAQFRLSAIGTTSIGAWGVENRHLLTVSTASVERYRVRLRAVRPDLFGRRALSTRAYDEVFFDFDSRRVFRNNIAVGIGVQMTDALNGEIYNVWEGNRSARDDRYVFAALTFRFGSPRRLVSQAR
jgi:hypothetical protein